MTSRPIIKVCGMRETENIREVEALGIDWLGMIFWPKSKRYVATPPSYLPTDVKKVGVFVDASLEDICQHIHNYQLDIIQLHGSEHPEFLRDLRNTCGSVSTIKIIKAFNIATVDDLLLTESYAGLADYFLFDTKGKMVAAMVSNSTGAYSSTTTVPRPIFSVAASVPKTPNEYIHSSTTITSVTAFWNTGS